MYCGHCTCIYCGHSTACTVAIAHACTVAIAHAWTVAIAHAYIVAIAHACIVAMAITHACSVAIRRRANGAGRTEPSARSGADGAERTERGGRCHKMKIFIHIQTFMFSFVSITIYVTKSHANSMKYGTEKTTTRRHQKMARPLCLDKSAFPFFFT